MSFKIDRGLFKYDFTDHHAVLGVPVDANFEQIRKRYLQIARCLHPDSCTATTPQGKQRANQLLSKIVNPAYEKFSKEHNRAEYLVLLREMGKHLSSEANIVELKSELAQKLAKADQIEQLYKTMIHQLAAKQYENLEQVLSAIGQISELNMIYLIRKGAAVAMSPTASSTTSTAKTTAQLIPEPQPTSVVEQYYRRAQALIEKNSYAQARVELQDALKIEPNNSSCHSLMGVLYLKQNQVTMAKVHINKALQLNPKEPMALKAKKLFDQTVPKSGESTSGKSTNNSGSGGLFGGLFGGKKK